MSYFPPSERQARLIWLATTGLALAVIAGLAVGLIWGLGQVLRLLAPVLWPLAVAGILAYLLDPVVDLLEARGASRPRAILIVFGVAVLLLGALVGVVVPQLVVETRQLAERVPSYIERMEEKAQHWLNNPPPLVRKWLERNTPLTPPASNVAFSNESMFSITTNALPIPSTNAPSLFASTFGDQQGLQNAAGAVAEALRRTGLWLFGRVASTFGVLAGLVLVPVYTFYFLLEKSGIASQWTDYLPVTDSGFKRELVFVLNAINNYLIAYFRGQVLVATCDGILYGLGFLVIGLPYALLIGVMAIVLTMIPFLGAIITCLTALVIALVQFGDWLHPALVLAVFGSVQMLEALVISPKIMGGRVGLHPVTIIIAVMVGTTLLGGLLGGVLAIPLTAALRVVMLRYVWKRPAPEFATTPDAGIEIPPAAAP